MDLVARIENLSFKYADTKKYALRNINLEVKKGEFVAIMGPTGAGKSTLTLTFNGIIPQVFEGKIKGKVEVCGLDTQEHSITELSAKVGLVLQNPETQLFCADVESEIAFGPENLKVPRDEIGRRIRESLKITRLEGLEKRPPFSLSGGQKQRLAIASILSMKPEIIVLDEPTSNLDPIGTREVFETVKKLKFEYGATIILVSHKSEFIAEYADRVVVLDNGKIIMNDVPSKIFSKKSILDRSFIRPPQVSEIAYYLMEKGVPLEKIPTTLDEAVEVFEKLLRAFKASKTTVSRLTKKRKYELAENLENEKKTPIINVKNLWHIYQPEGVVAIKDISLSIFPNEFIAIIGQNGAGKTTLVKHFNGLLKPTKGKVIVKGKDTRMVQAAEISKIVGYIFQNPDHQLFADSVEKEVAFGPSNLGLPEEEIKKRVDEALKFMGLEHLREEHPLSLSWGDRLRVAIASVISMKPEVLILDEPTTGQDFKGSRQILDVASYFYKQGATIIMITHDIPLVAEYAQRTIVMSQGQILLDGRTEEVLKHINILKSTYLEPPQVTQLCQRISKYGVPENITKVEDFCDAILSLIGRGES